MSVTDETGSPGAVNKRNGEDIVTDAASRRSLPSRNWWDIEDLEKRQRAWEEQGIRPWDIEDPEERKRAYEANDERADYVRAKHARIVAEGKNCSECGAEIGDTVYRYKPLLQRGYDGTAYRRNPTVNADPICAACAPDWLPGLETRVYKLYMYSHRMPCAACGRGVVFVSAYETLPSSGVFCSEDCKTKNRIERRERYRTCEVCEKPFTATRSDAKTCSPACKQKAYRRRVKDQA